ncbi:response regulator transcription factor [Hymenobacter cellulosilyticus]|uniref:Response regulator transcription factor n=1 Tax=Hymenobacter cellulosilyticus TaxID=2932248 RepID=A0A8T9PY59_9BACT|nr:response regulator transcription factor [Hymenobacter cellulosilyticus]UOQ69987.1 response regulator transcription factor [Hymenobacter cellulosilyticus]
MATVSRSVHIALLDDHALFRQGLRYILQSLPYVETVVEAATFAELLAHCRQRLPDVLLLDLQMPEVDGAEATRLLLAEFPDLKIIVLSMFSADKFITQMMKLGVRSYLPKDSDQEQLSQALEAVLLTGHHFTPSISRALMRAVQHPTRQQPTTLPHLVQLTPRELEVLHRICQGRKASEIADELFLSRRTVEGHRQNLLEKTGAPNSAGLVVYAAQHGLLPE